MTTRLAAMTAVIGLLQACAAAPDKPVELLDERTGVSVAGLERPIELVREEILTVGRRSTIALLGPVEWDRMGEISYGLWLHLSPGNDRPLADIHAPATVTLVLADGLVPLVPMVTPPLGSLPYKGSEPWGQTAYFELTPALLKRIAATPQLSLRCRAADGAAVEFRSYGDSRAALGAYLRERGLTAD